MQELIKQVQEACAAVCEQKVSDRMDGYRVAAAIRALDLSHLTGWQDISTAPKDGTDVLLSMPYGMPPRVAGYFKDGWYSFDRPDDEIKDPSHWMPLPAPPKPSK